MMADHPAHEVDVGARDGVRRGRRCWKRRRLCRRGAAERHEERSPGQASRGERAGHWNSLPVKMTFGQRSQAKDRTPMRGSFLSLQALLLLTLPALACSSDDADDPVI